MILLAPFGLAFMLLGIALDCWTTISFMKKEGVELEAHAIPRNLFQKYGAKGVIGLDAGFACLTVLFSIPLPDPLQFLTFVTIGVIWMVAGVRNLVLAK